MNPTFRARVLKPAAAAVLFAAIALLPVRTTAADLFVVSVTLGPPVAPVGANSLLDLVDKLVKNTDQFNPLFGSAYTAQLNYAGVANAIQFSANAAGTSASLYIPSTGLNQNFNGANRQELENAIEQFIKTSGSEEFARFLKTISAQSLVSLTDGNPNASTAQSSSQAFQTTGMTLAETRDEKEGDKPPVDRGGFGVIADIGSFNANGIKGTVYSLPMFARFKLTERVGLNLDLPLSYLEIEGAKAYGLGFGVGFPIKVVQRTKESPWSWRVTPFGSANGTGSKDLAAGGLLASGGMNSLLARDFGSFALSMGNQFSVHEGVPITLAGFTFDPGVSQQILKNGLKLDIPIGRRWVFDTYVMHTKFLSPAAVDQYFTVGGELGFRMSVKADSPSKSGGYLKLGGYADVGDNYTSAHVRFGSAWKF